MDLSSDVLSSTLTELFYFISELESKIMGRKIALFTGLSCFCDTQLRQFHAQPFPEILYSSAAVRSARPAALADAHHNTRKKKDCSQLKVRSVSPAFH